MKKIVVPFKVLLCGLILVSCGGGDDGDDGGGSCTIPAVAGEPDITGAPFFDSSVITSGDLLTVTVPFDADVAFVAMVTLAKYEPPTTTSYSSFLIGAIVPGEQNWQYEYNTADMPPGDYFLELTLCSDPNSCNSGSSGVGVRYAAASPSNEQYIRYKFWDNGDTFEGMDTCIDVPHVTIN